MQQLIQALTQYNEALEQRLATAETRIAALTEILSQTEDNARTLSAQLTEQNSALRVQLADTETKMAALGQRLAELEAQVNDALTDADDYEPEEDIEDELEPEPEIIQEEPEVVPETKPEPVKEEPVKEAAPQPIVIDETPAPAPAPAPAPTSAPTSAPAASAKYGTHVDDIRKAISIGDRFLFQRELFAQNGETMQKTFDAINACASIDDAIAYLDKHFSWDKDSPTYQLFLTPLHRRFN